MSDPMLFWKTTLKSGLEVWYQYREMDWFACRLVVMAGHLQDPPGQEGTAHLLEHHLSAGTEGMPRMSRVELDRWLDDRQFSVELGRTGLFETSFGGKTFAEKGCDLLRFLSDFVFRPALDGDLEHDREIVRAERIERRSSRGLKIEDALQKAVFRGHRRATATGLPEDAVLDGLTGDDLRRFHRRWYGPANAKLIVVGGLNMADTIEINRLENIFPTERRPELRIAARPEPAECAVPDPLEDEFPAESMRKARSVRIEYLWCFPPVKKYVDVLARNALRQALHERLREELRATYHVSVSTDAEPDCTLFAVSTEVTPGKVGLARAAIETALAHPRALLTRLPEIRQCIAFEMRMADLNVAGVLRRAEEQIVNHGCTRSLRDIAQAFERTTDEEVAAFIEERLGLDRAYVRLIHD